jgi:sarcosine oxidase subunit beta
MDAIIIGAGVIGTSIALALTRQGLKTLNIDTLPSAGYGSTSNSSAIIRPFYSAVTSCALAHEARSRWINWPEFLAFNDERGYASYVNCGMLMLLSEQDEACFQPSLRAMNEVGVKFERLSPPEIITRFPSFNMHSFSPPKLPDHADFGRANKEPLAGGYFIPEAGYVSDPQLATHNLQRAAENLGAEFRFNTRVVAINNNGDRITGVTTGDGVNIEAAVVVNAAGPHSSKVNALAGTEDAMAVATKALRHEVAHVPLPAGFGQDQAACVVGDGDCGVYLRPDLTENILVGSLDPECDARENVDPDRYETELTEQWTNQVWRAALRIPGLAIPNTARGVVGLYDATPDWTPIYDKSSLPGYYMAIGTSGNQFKNAPVVGELMARLITACEAGHDHDTSPVSFHLRVLNRHIDLGFYSRNRVLHLDSSNTVLA